MTKLQCQATACLRYDKSCMNGKKNDWPYQTAVRLREGQVRLREGQVISLNIHRTFEQSVCSDMETKNTEKHIPAFYRSHSEMHTFSANNFL